MCLYPRLITNRKYIANKKNGGVIPAVSDERTKLVPVGCGKCMECMKKKARDWNVRLMEESRSRRDGVMVTLTFSDESIAKLAEGIKLSGYELDNEIAKKATRLFLERWRKKYKKSIRHWLVTELGHNGTENIHMHGIMWTDKPKTEIEKIWGYGYTWFGTYVNERTVNYITKYVHKIDQDHKEYKPRILTSAGIGGSYVNRKDAKNNKYKEGKTNEAYKNRQGYKMALPIYYRNKIYTEDEREKLWIEKLDEEKRYVNGIEVDISKGDEKYYKVLEEQRRINKQLGYGDDSINWDRKRYERERRIGLQKTRIEKGKTKQDAACRGGDAPVKAAGGEAASTDALLINKHMEKTKKNTDGIW